MSDPMDLTNFEDYETDLSTLVDEDLPDALSGEADSEDCCDLWFESVHYTGYMVAEETTSTSQNLDQAKDHDPDATSITSSSDDEREHEPELTEENGGDEVGLQVDTSTQQLMIARMNAMSKEELEAIKCAYDLLRRGLSAEPHNKSSRSSLQDTPSPFSELDITFRPHQRHAAGILIEIALGDSSAPSDSLAALPGAVLKFAMGLGKTFIFIAVVNAVVKRHPDATVLIVVPLSIRHQWRQDLEKYLVTSSSANGKRPLLVYGSEQSGLMTRDDLEGYNVILTHLEVVRAEYTAYQDFLAASATIRRSTLLDSAPAQRKLYPLMVIDFYLMMVDEVGLITKQSSKQTLACQAIKASKRLGCSGTPLRNDYPEIQALFKWLRIPPWDAPEYFKKYFITKLSKKKKRRPKNRASKLQPTRNAILAFMLRTFVFPLSADDLFDGKRCVDYPNPVWQKITHDLSPAEQQAQEIVRAQWDRAYRRELEDLKRAARKEHLGTGGDSLTRSNVLPEIQRARMQCVHLLCGQSKYGDRGDSDYLPGNDLSATIDNVRELNADASKMSASAKQNRERLLQDTKENYHSSRIDKLIPHLKQRLQETDGKVLIFDEFLSTLDVVSNALKANDIEFVLYNGLLKPSQRIENLKVFQENPKFRVMLITVQCGGLGLNLTAAETVYILTPRWNPADDEQAAARCIRMPQKKCVRVYTFQARESIEMRTNKLRRTKTTESDNLLRPEKLTKQKYATLNTWDFAKFKEEMSKIEVVSKQIEKDDQQIT